jgi:hypothetical protein
MWPAIIVGLVIGVTVLGVYWGKKLAGLTKDVEARDGYIKKQGEVIAAFMAAMERQGEVDAFKKRVDAASSADELSKLYAELVSRNAKN